MHHLQQRNYIHTPFIAVQRCLYTFPLRVEQNLQPPLRCSAQRLPQVPPELQQAEQLGALAELFTALFGRPPPWLHSYPHAFLN